MHPSSHSALRSLLASRYLKRLRHWPREQRAVRLVADSDGPVSWPRPAPGLTLSLPSWQTLDGHMVVRSHARVSSLTLKSIQYTDAGEYICTASNTIGQDSQSVYLEVQCEENGGKTGGREGRAAAGTRPMVVGPWPFQSCVPKAPLHSIPRLLTSLRVSLCSSWEGTPISAVPRHQLGLKAWPASRCQEMEWGEGSRSWQSSWELSSFFADAPKLQGPVAVYTWEGNQVNITCEVFAYPGATISWFRDGQLLPSSNYSNIKIYNTPSASYLEVRRGGGGQGGGGAVWGWAGCWTQLKSSHLLLWHVLSGGATGWGRKCASALVFSPELDGGLGGRVCLSHDPLFCSLWVQARLQLYWFYSLLILVQ